MVLMNILFINIIDLEHFKLRIGNSEKSIMTID